MASNFPLMYEVKINYVFWFKCLEMEDDYGVLSDKYTRCWTQNIFSRFVDLETKSIGNKEWQEGEEITSDWWKTSQYQSRIDTLRNKLLKFLSKNWTHQVDFLYTCRHLVGIENVPLYCISYADKVK